MNMCSLYKCIISVKFYLYIMLLCYHIIYACLNQMSDVIRSYYLRLPKSNERRHSLILFTLA